MTSSISSASTGQCQSSNNEFRNTDYVCPIHISLDSDSSLKFGHRGNPADTPGSEDERGFYLGEPSRVQLQREYDDRGAAGGTTQGHSSSDTHLTQE
jgi:hypothetical protein